MHTAHRLTAAVALAGAAALGLTGCLDKPSRSYPGASAPKMLNESVTALRSASSFTVSGKTVTKGVPTRVELSISKTGECTGTMSMPEGVLKVVRTHDHVYLQGDEAFARAQTQDLPADEAEQAFKDTTTLWMRKEASDPSLKGLASLCDRDGMLKAFYSFSGDAVESGPAEAAGRKAVSIVAAKHVFLVAAEGEPYLLKVTKAGPEGLDLAYTGINQPVQVDVPAEADVYEVD
ncbi:hypothetical protein ACFVFI_29065 [Streptomyces sp. NPDC057705]|uniref:hypothetical protein n=1 Tax=Streptomyces sp. NPDC057705 TaxID=3346222 RepID=UPI0036BCA88A